MMELDSDSNDVRAIAIFGGYLSICGLLTGIIIKDLFAEHRKPKTRNSLTPIWVLASCAAICLSITWYHMLSFFSLSYRAWALKSGITLPTSPHNVLELGQWIRTIQLGAWLRDVKLFREAWEIAMETPGRLFWSQPIFFISSIWAFFVGHKVSIRRIKHGWVYMVLGQIVAISFAQNLFYLAVALSEMANEENRPASSNEADSKALSKISDYHGMLRRLIFALVGFAAVLIPESVHTPRFLWILALPHLALLLPPLIEPLLVTRTTTVEDRAIAYADIGRLYRFIAFIALLPQVKTIISVRNGISAPQHLHRHSAAYEHPILDLTQSTASSNLFHGILASLYDHPAVTSVGWDSILCILNYLVWTLLVE